MRKDAWLRVLRAWCSPQVVRGAQSAKITLFNNQSFDAELKGSEPDKDLAVLKIVRPSNAKFVPISVGSSSGLQVWPLRLLHASHSAMASSDGL